MANTDQPAMKPVPFSGYLDLALSVLFPLACVSVILGVVFWQFVRPGLPVSDDAVPYWVAGILALGATVGVFNAIRYYRRAYKGKAEPGAAADGGAR